MSTQLSEKRSKLIADRQAFADLLAKEGRAPTAQELEQDQARAKEIDGLAVSMGIVKSAKEQAEALDAAVKAAIGRGDINPDNPEDQIGDKEIKGYSIRKVYQHLLDGKPAGELGGVEGEQSRFLASKRHNYRGGVIIPTRVLTYRRPRNAIITTTTGAGGVSTVTTGDYIDALRSVSLLGPLGITTLGGLQGKLSIPRSSGFTAYWPGEGTAVTISSNTIDNVTFSPKTVGVYQDVTRTMMNQTSLDIDMYLENGLLRTIGSALSDAALTGTGGTNTFLGVMNNTDTCMITATTGVGATSGATTLQTTATGQAMSWALAVKMEGVVLGANGAGMSPAYVVEPAGMAVLKTTAKSTNAGIFICEDGVMNGYPVLQSSGAADSSTNSAFSALFGFWDDAVLGLWGGPELTVDPFALATSGGRRIIALQDADFQLRQPDNFCRMYGIAL